MQAQLSRPWSNSSPSGVEELVRRACLPSTPSTHSKKEGHGSFHTVHVYVNIYREAHKHTKCKQVFFFNISHFHFAAHTHITVQSLWKQPHSCLPPLNSLSHQLNCTSFISSTHGSILQTHPRKKRHMESCFISRVHKMVSKTLNSRSSGSQSTSLRTNKHTNREGIWQ